MSAVTIRRLRTLYPDLFYAQTWYLREPFLDTPLPTDHPTTMPTGTRGHAEVPTVRDALPLAVTLINLYVKHPEHACWQDYAWCADVDRHGQRVYIGGTANGGGLELHRHLHITHRWRRVVWK